METFNPAQKGETDRGVQIDPLASRAAENILGIFDQLSINPEEMPFLEIPVVSAYVQGMQALPHDTKNINFDALKDQVHLVMARELVRRQVLGGRMP